jgi:octanoyl-[GcvH]:protein N-octanoyltransferase
MSRILLDCPPLPGGPAHDVALGPALLRAGLDPRPPEGPDGPADPQEVVRVFVPSATAAFSRRDTLRPGFADAVAAVRRHGFAPVVRFPGGRLALYHPGSVVVDHVRRERRASLDVEGRFAEYAALVVDVLTARGVDARVGEVPGEYCPGAFTVNGGGVVKLAGSAQRLTRDGWLFSTIVQVTDAPALRQPLAEASEALGYDLALSTVGAVDDLRPGTTVQEIAAALREAWQDEGATVVRALPTHLLDVVEEVAAGNPVDGVSRGRRASATPASPPPHRPA